MTFPKLEAIRRTAEQLQGLRDEVAKAVVGQGEAVDQLLTALVASGHVLIEGMPGLGKTLLARAFAKALQLHFSRVQFTPDLMPTDITGHAVLDPSTRTEVNPLGSLRVQRGPVFTNFLLADEINRAPAKTQSALLEVMQEVQVTLEGQSIPLPRPFLVIATQNPIDTEGTYPLPEAQLDRFLFKVQIGYPTQAEESDIVKRATHRQAGDQLPLDAVRQVFDAAMMRDAQALVSKVHVDHGVSEYAVRIVRATRQWPGLALGAGPRGAIALVRAARAQALIQARDFVTPDDIKAHVLPTLRHRVNLAPDAQLEGRTVDELLGTAVASVAAPRL